MEGLVGAIADGVRGASFVPRAVATAWPSAGFSLVAILWLSLTFYPAAQLEAKAPRSIAYINGVATQVEFSDGDTFNAKEGKLQGNSRLAGFNTLESFGPAHQWGKWHPFELWVNAKQATLHARRGIWHCTSDGSRDGYDRLLMHCPDLAMAQIRKGFAHAMEIYDRPSEHPAYLRAQNLAKREKRGFWKHGIPDFIVTSMHSKSEDITKNEHRNRLISTHDGHTEGWTHNDAYSECSWQCGKTISADKSKVRKAAKALRAGRFRSELQAIANYELIELVDRYARLETFPEWAFGKDPGDEDVEDKSKAEDKDDADEVPIKLNADLKPNLSAHLKALRDGGALGQTREVVDSCMIYVAFERRYKHPRARCLKGRGNWQKAFRNPLGSATKPGAQQ